MHKITTTTIICVLALLLLALAACNTQDPTPQQYTLNELLDIARERRLAIQPPDYQWILDEFHSREATVPLQPSSDNDAVLPVSPLYVTTQGAIDDIMLLFHVLRSSYGPYIYFGGDDVFFPFRDALIDEIQDIVNTYGEIRTTEFHRIVLAGLRSVIDDNHFLFNGRLIGRSATFFASDTPFDRNEQGFWHRESGRRVVEIEGHDMYSVLRVSMDEQANVFYSAVIYTLEPPGLPRRILNLVFEDGSTYELVLQRHVPDRREYEPTRLEWVNGIPIITFRWLMMRHVETTFAPVEQVHEAALQTRNFLSYASELRGEPIVVVDIRGNPGGNGVCDIFLHRLMGSFVPVNHARIAGRALTTTPRQGPLINSDTMIVLVADRHTASAGEMFVDRLFSMENTLVVGQNTFGMVVAGGVPGVSSFLSLPHSHSGFHVGFSNAFFSHPQGHVREGVGYAPDIWVHGDALTAALALIDNNRDD